MIKVFRWLKIVLPFLQMAEGILEDMDENETGKDDDAGHFIGYVINGLTAIIAGLPIPAPPKALTDKAKK